MVREVRGMAWAGWEGGKGEEVGTEDWEAGRGRGGWGENRRLPRRVQLSEVNVSIACGNEVATLVRYTAHWSCVERIPS